MKKGMFETNMLKLGAALLVLTTAGGCAQRTVVTTQTEVKEVAVERDTRKIPGVVEYVWEEPMVDVVEVPPGIDPEGHYYRPGHQEVVEIRQGRWNYYKQK
ncbi:MAG: hypothetical protein K1X79_09540 [Oligoflexia bacterium]|nr:hypothetical protein [Oligoflexia bacterium]